MRHPKDELGTEKVGVVGRTPYHSANGRWVTWRGRGQYLPSEAVEVDSPEALRSALGEEVSAAQAEAILVRIRDNQKWQNHSWHPSNAGPEEVLPGIWVDSAQAYASGPCPVPVS